MGAGIVGTRSPNRSTVTGQIREGTEQERNKDKEERIIARGGDKRKMEGRGKMRRRRETTVEEGSRRREQAKMEKYRTNERKTQGRERNKSRRNAREATT